MAFHAEHSSGIARDHGPKRYALRRQVKIEKVNAHGLMMSPNSRSPQAERPTGRACLHGVSTSLDTNGLKIQFPLS
jgi:hypothetical protein